VLKKKDTRASFRSVDLLPSSKKKAKVLKSAQSECLESIQTGEKLYVTCTVWNSLQNEPYHSLLVIPRKTKDSFDYSF